jgi:trehalose 6-phosphate phosphatase
MNPLFSKNSMMILESLSFTRTLFAFDFDGTLSKIVRVPSEAKISKLTSDLLQKLSKHAPVAIISGRSLEDLKQRIFFKPQYLVGNHGLEIEGATKYQMTLDNAKKDSELWKEVLQTQEYGVGVEIEDKTFSLAIHYRRSRNKKESRKKIQYALEQLSPLPRIITGKYVFNLLPMGAPHKGIAVLELMKLAESKHVFYIGDDDTDEDVFSMANEKIMSVRVGEKKISSASYFIKRQSEINHLLKILIRYHSSSNGKRMSEARL